jgi:hypothetical protein
MMNRTIAEAKKMICPILSFKHEKVGYVKCLADGCTAWEEVYCKEKREDHSGGDMVIMSRGIETNRQAYREGGPGCSGHWILDATGRCNLIETTIKIK